MALIRGGTIKQSRPPWSKLLGGRNETLGVSSSSSSSSSSLGAVSKSRENVLPFFSSLFLSFFFFLPLHVASVEIPRWTRGSNEEGSEGPADADDRLGGIRSK